MREAQVVSIDNFFNKAAKRILVIDSGVTIFLDTSTIQEICKMGLKFEQQEENLETFCVCSTNSESIQRVMARKKITRVIFTLQMIYELKRKGEDVIVAIKKTLEDVEEGCKSSWYWRYNLPIEIEREIDAS
jgi:hypothetical protein